MPMDRNFLYDFLMMFAKPSVTDAELQRFRTEVFALAASHGFQAQWEPGPGSGH